MGTGMHKYDPVIKSLPSDAAATILSASQVFNLNTSGASRLNGRAAFESNDGDGMPLSAITEDDQLWTG